MHEDMLLLMYLLQHASVLCVPVDGEGDVLARDENELLMFIFFSMWMFSAYL